MVQLLQVTAPIGHNYIFGLQLNSAPHTAVIKKYYLGKMAPELLCTIYGPNITSGKKPVIGEILPVQSLLAIGPILP
jgi:hypothetical protein